MPIHAPGRIDDDKIGDEGVELISLYRVAYCDLRIRDALKPPPARCHRGATYVLASVTNVHP
nr:hypothetical protein [Tessaracoccus sp. MC1865]